MPFAVNKGVRIFWDERGEGTPLLLVMGHTYSSAMWYLAIDELAKHHRVIWLDNRGTGKSTTTIRYSVGDMARDAFAVMDAAGVETAHVYGVSMGGGIIIEMARQHPERIRSLVLGCTLAKTPDLGGIPLWLRPLVSLPGPLFVRLMAAINGAPKPNTYGTAAPAEKIAADERLVSTASASAWTSARQTRAIGRYSITADEVSAFAMPSIVVHGDEDTKVAYEAGVTLHGLIAQSELVTLKGAGHNYFVARGDEANAAVLDFLSRVDGTATKRQKPRARSLSR